MKNWPLEIQKSVCLTVPFKLEEQCVDCQEKLEQCEQQYLQCFQFNFLRNRTVYQTTYTLPNLPGNTDGSWVIRASSHWPPLLSEAFLINVLFNDDFVGRRFIGHSAAHAEVDLSEGPDHKSKLEIKEIHFEMKEH